MRIQESKSLKSSLVDQMRAEVTDELLERITLRIVKAFHPRKVILFGSHAYGFPHIDSDVDLLVVMDVPTGERPVKRSRRVRATLGEGFVPMDILVRTPDEIDARLKMGDFFMAEILQKGRVLYQDAPA